MKPIIIILSLIAFFSISCNKNGRIEDISQNIEISLSLDSPDYSKKIESNLSDNPKRVDGKKLVTSSALVDFYVKRNYDQAWTSRKGLNSLGQELFEFIKEASDYGLNPDWYHFQEINSILKQKKHKAEELANIDILLTDSYMLLAGHLAYGALDEEKNGFAWKWEKRNSEGELSTLLQQSWENENIKTGLSDLQPNWFEYANLQKGLEKFLDKYEINNIKHPIPDLKADSAEAYKVISQLLVELKLLDKNNSNNYDQIKESLKEFQKMHGIPVDGVIGDYTLEALSMSTEDRYNQIAINLDRMRSRGEVPETYIYVNIPAYHLKFVVNNNIKQRFNVIVGTTTDQTPEMTDEMTFIETFPYWHVPASIVNEEILPKLKENPSHMSAQGYRVIDNKNNIEMDPVSFNWNDFTTENYEYSIRQDGDSINSLGLIKFMFPNKQNIYIHDTPARHLFIKDMRSFSHGCIRINEPLQFAEILLKHDDNKYTSEDVKNFILNKQNRQLKLNEPAAVLIRYFTAEADDNGNVYLYKDIYEKDKTLLSIYNRDQIKLVSSK